MEEKTEPKIYVVLCDRTPMFASTNREDAEQALTRAASSQADSSKYPAYQYSMMLVDCVPWWS